MEKKFSKLPSSYPLSLGEIKARNYLMDAGLGSKQLNKVKKTLSFNGINEFGLL